MVKIGEDKEPYDPFEGSSERSAETQAALSSALDGLDKKPGNRTQAKQTTTSKKTDSSVSPATTKQKKIKKPTTDTATTVTSEQPKRFSKRFQATRAEASEYETAALRLSSAVRSKIDFSKITRVLWQVYLRHEEDILRNVTEDDHLPTPRTGDDVGLAKLEEDLKKVINRGLMIASRRPTNHE